jgi:hypothetical protein|tara:strand:+ start:108 stop:317 length:210 start_codon:yes stop_codon:yes gene_type:complete
MIQRERDEIIIRVDERIKNIYNRMEKFEVLFTNHLTHHEMWEKDLRRQMRWWVGIAITAAGGAGAMGMM